MSKFEQRYFMKYQQNPDESQFECNACRRVRSWKILDNSFRKIFFEMKLDDVDDLVQCDQCKVFVHKVIDSERWNDFFDIVVMFEEMFRIEFGREIVDMSRL